MSEYEIQKKIGQLSLLSLLLCKIRICIHGFKTVDNQSGYRIFQGGSRIDKKKICLLTAQFSGNNKEKSGPLWPLPQSSRGMGINKIANR